MDWAKEDRETATADYDTIRLISSSDGTIPEKGLRSWIDESKAALKIDREILSTKSLTFRFCPRFKKS
jgi:hypothetical protein